jgi:integrase
MVCRLKEDEWNEERLTRRLRTLLSPDHPFYRVVLTVLRRRTTMASAMSTVDRVNVFLSVLKETGLDPLEMTRDDAEDWWVGVNRRVAPVTADGYLTDVRSLYLEAIDRGLVPADPTKGLKVGRYEARRAPALTYEQANLLIDAVRGDLSDPKRRLQAARDYALVAIGLTIGFRTAELRRLSWSDLWFDGVPRAELYRKGRSNDVQKVSPLAMEALLLFRKVLVEETGIELTGEDAVFPALSSPRLLEIREGRAARPLPPAAANAVRDRVRVRLAEIGVTGRKLGPHRLRATAATLAYQASADPVAIQRLMNHRSVDTTFRYYINPARKLNESACDFIDLRPAGLLEADDE